MTLDRKSVILTDDAVDGELPEDILGRMGVLSGNILKVFAFEDRLKEVMSIPEVLFTESAVGKLVEDRKHGQRTHGRGGGKKQRGRSENFRTMSDEDLYKPLPKSPKEDARTVAIYALNATYEASGWPIMAPQVEEAYRLELISLERKAVEQDALYLLDEQIEQAFLTRTYVAMVGQMWPAMLKGQSILQLIAHARCGGKVTEMMEEAAGSSPLPLGQAILTYDTIKALTQEWFAERGYGPADEFEVYRALRLQPDSPIPDSTDFEDNPLSPWTTEKAIALSFALSWPGRKAIVLSTWVKVEDIFSLGVAGFGSSEEAECVLESGKIGQIKVEVMEVSGDI